MKYLRLVCADPKVDIKVQMGDGPATPTAGVAGWEVTPRAGGRRGITTRTSPPPFQQDVPIYLNGLAQGNSVQRQLDQILSLGEPGAQPFKAIGPIHRGDGRLWVFGGEPDYGEAIRDDDEDSTLLRQRLTLKLLLYQRPDVVKERRRRGRGRGGGGKVAQNVAVGGTYTTRKGDTLQSIAAELYNDWREWQSIGNKNGLSDPTRKLPPGKVLKL